MKECLKGAFGVALVFEILEYFVYTPVSQTSGRLKIPPLNALSVLLIY